jgi:GTP cyclohydrolase I
LKFAADLSLPRKVSKTQRRDRINALLHAFGINNQADTLVGTPIRLPEDAIDSIHSRRNACLRRSPPWPAAFSSALS